MNFNKFSKDIDEAANSINMKKAVGTERRGKAKIRDKFIFGKISWTEALSYISIIQSIIIFTALIPNSVQTVNSFLDWFGIPFNFPLELSSVGAIVFIFVVFIFGLIAVRHIGTTKRAQEISAKLNPAILLLWEQNQKIIENQEKILKMEGKE